MSVGKNIKARRKQLHISAETLAARLGLSPSTIYRYESGDVEKIDSGKLIPIAEALNTTPSYLMGWPETAPTISADSPEAASEAPAQPDLDAAARAAADILIKHRVSAAPIMPLTILQSMPDVFVVSFTEFADTAGPDRRHTASKFGSESQDAITVAKTIDGRTRYFVAYNQRLPFYMVQLALARELGRIALGHAQGRSGEAQTAEALYFAWHLLCPRPLIRAIREAGHPLTVGILGNITGCYGRTLAGIRQTPGARIPAAVNQLIKDQFSAFVRDFGVCLSAMSSDDDSGPADFGTYMDNYMD